MGTCCAPSLSRRKLLNFKFTHHDATHFDMAEELPSARPPARRRLYGRRLPGLSGSESVTPVVQPEVRLSHWQ